MALILDTGPLYASLDRRDEHHQSARALLQATRERLVIPAPVLVEVDYLLTRRKRPAGMVHLIEDIKPGAYSIEEVQYDDYWRIGDICERYADANVGFVDAAVLSIVERLREPKLATLDHRHFGLLQPRHVEALELLPHPRPAKARRR